MRHVNVAALSSARSEPQRRQRQAFLSRFYFAYSGVSDDGHFGNRCLSVRAGCRGSGIMPRGASSQGSSATFTTRFQPMEVSCIEVSSYRSRFAMDRALMILISGCDDRAAQIAREAAAIARPSRTRPWLELNKEVASGTHRLVEASALARKEIVGVHRDLQAERARLDTSWTDLEQERTSNAAERRYRICCSATCGSAGLLAVVALVLGFCWYAS